MKYNEFAKIVIGMQNLDIADDLESRFRLSKNMKDTEMQELVSQLVEGGFASGLDNIVNNRVIDKIVSKAVMSLTSVKTASTGLSTACAWRSYTTTSMCTTGRTLKG